MENKETRIIKFRGKRKSDGKFVFGDLRQDLNATVINDQFGHDSTVIPETVGQFIGKKDNNGKEIYEDDIISINTWYDYIVPDDYVYKYKEEKGIAYYLVKWDISKCAFYLELISCTKTTPRAKIIDVSNGHLIVGNLHDNPELINNQNNK